MALVIGTAGWSVDRKDHHFAQTGTGLERYASFLGVVEINSSFYRRHRQATWQRWHDAVPDRFRFSVKLPRVITHDHKLVDAGTEIETFFDDIVPLGAKAGPILIQLPPSLDFDAGVAEDFLRALRKRWQRAIVLEPRHVSWAENDASVTLGRFEIGRVYADPQEPALREAALLARPSYFRLHGSPKVYYSRYDDAELRMIAGLLPQGGEAWCMFDNTASGAAIARRSHAPPCRPRRSRRRARSRRSFPSRLRGHGFPRN